MSTTTRWWWIRHAPVDSGGLIYGQDDLAADCSDPRPFRWLANVLPRDALWVVTPLKRTQQLLDLGLRLPARGAPLACGSLPGSHDLDPPSSTSNSADSSTDPGASPRNAR